MKTLYFLKPKGPIAVRGGLRDGLLPRSDTLSAALLSVWKHVDASVDMNSLAAGPPFRISSAMPWIIGPEGHQELLMPIPLHTLKAVSGSSRSNSAAWDHKKLKRAAFADRKVLSPILSCGLPPDDCHEIDGGFLLASFPRVEPFACRSSRTRLAVDRLSGGPIPGLLFECAEWKFGPDAGFAVVCDYVDTAVSQYLDAAIRLLGMEGIGADRTCGLGHFEIGKTVCPWEAPDLGQGFRMLISLCHPTREDIGTGILDGRYTLVERSGWITAPGARTLRRGRLRMLAEGSWYPDRLVPFPGANLCVQEPQEELGLGHPVYRDGRALTIAISRGEDHA